MDELMDDLNDLDLDRDVKSIADEVECALSAETEKDVLANVESAAKLAEAFAKTCRLFVKNNRESK